MLVRRRAVQQSNRRTGRVATQVVDGQQRSADDSLSQEDALPRKQGGIGRFAKLGEQLLVRKRGPRRVGAERDIKDRRVFRKARAAAQDLLKGQIVGPDKCQPVVKSTELALEFTTPEPAEWSRPHQHEHLRGLRPQLENGLDGARILVVDRDSGFLVSKRRVIEKPLIDGREQEGRIGKKLLPILARKHGRGAGDSHDEVRLGTIREGGADVVDHRLFWRADKPCWSHHDLHDVHRLGSAPVQFDAEVAGELVHR